MIFRRHRIPAGALVLFVLLAALGTASVAAGDLDLDTAIAMAIENNLGIRSAVADARQKKLVADTWWNQFYPSTSVTATLGRMNADQTGFDFTTFRATDNPQWFLSLGLDFSLNLTMQLFPGYNLAHLDYRLGLITLEDAERKLTRDVRTSFYDLLLLKEQILLVREQLTTAERRYRQALANYENGLVDEYTMLSARVAWENQKPGITGLEAAFQQALMGFKLQIGLLLTSSINPVGTIDPPALTLTQESVDRNQLVDRLDIRQLDLLENLLAEQESLSRSARLPVVSFGLGFDPSFTADPWGDNWFDTDLWSQRSGMFRMTVVQPLDGWLPFSKINNDIAGTQTEIEKNRYARAQALHGAEMQVRSLIMSIKSSEETVAALELNIDLARRAFTLAETGYNAGLRDLLEVQNAEVELKSAQFQVLQQKKNIMSNLIALEYALQMDLTGDNE